MNITYEGTYSIVRVLVYIICFNMYYIQNYHYNYGGSHASDILHFVVLMPVSVAYVTNNVILCIMRPQLYAK